MSKESTKNSDTVCKLVESWLGSWERFVDQTTLYSITKQCRSNKKIRVAVARWSVEICENMWKWGTTDLRRLLIKKWIKLHLLQSSSSEWSPQSLAPSQTHCAGMQRPVLIHVNWSSRHASFTNKHTIQCISQASIRGELPRKMPNPPPRKFAAGRNIRNSHTVLLKYKKKPFEPDAVAGCQISQNCLCCSMELRPRPHWKRSLLLISHHHHHGEDGSRPSVASIYPRNTFGI